MSGTEYTGFQDIYSAGDEANAQAFLIRKLLSQTSTATLVKVLSCTNSGGLSPVGSVNVIPMVTQIDGAGNSLAHGSLYGLPYFRLQGGSNAVIIDPVAGDIGIAVFADRDISSVTATKEQAPPGSFRRFSMADGLYLGGFLNAVPTQYVQFISTGINLVSPTKVTITAPAVEADASTSFTVNSPTIALNGMVTQTKGSASAGTVTLVGPLNVTNDVVAGSISLENHIHTGVTAGSGTTGGPEG